MMDCLFSLTGEILTVAFTGVQRFRRANAWNCEEVFVSDMSVVSLYLIVNH